MGKLIVIEREKMLKALREFEALVKIDPILQEEVERFEKQRRDVIRRRDAAAAEKLSQETDKKEGK